MKALPVPNNMVFPHGPSAHLRTLATLAGIGTIVYISRSLAPFTASAKPSVSDLSRSSPYMQLIATNWCLILCEGNSNDARHGFAGKERPWAQQLGLVTRAGTGSIRFFGGPFGDGSEVGFDFAAILWRDGCRSAFSRIIGASLAKLAPLAAYTIDTGGL